MHFEFRKISEEHVNIVLSWKREEEFACYDVDGTRMEIENLMNSVGFDCFIAFDEDDEPAGFLECTFDDQGIMDIVNFINPEKKGMGLGTDFVSECIDFALQHYDYEEMHIKLMVETLNRGAIKVYERVGFQKVDECDEWIEMHLEL